jgi:hypothetical protein
VQESDVVGVEAGGWFHLVENRLIVIGSHRIRILNLSCGGPGVQ